MQEINNHVHSTCSFSPYAPADIPARAKEAGLGTVGIMDHDSVAGCAEFLDAAKKIGIAATAGCELRVNMDGTLVEGRKTNNPDEPNVSYIALHGIPRTRFDAVAEFLKPIHDARIARDRKEVERLNAKLAELGAPVLDFEKDVVAISEAPRGGSITERHILYALSLKLIAQFGKGAALVDFVEQQMQIPIPGKLKELLLNVDNPHYAYDLLGVFKSALVPEFFILSGKDECISVYDAVKFANDIGAIPAYAYLGDVGESPTGDKKAEKFEDDYLDELVPELKKIGFKAITYMPPRNTREQLARLRRLCQENELMEISGVDINSSRQSFNCPILLEPEFCHLADAAWALIAHEKLAAEVPTLGIFHPENPKKFQTLEKRIEFYSTIGRRIDHTQPEKAIELI
jgi:sugar phosphate isomerase/epimerase